MSTDKQERNRKETDLVLEVTPPEVGHLKISVSKSKIHGNTKLNPSKGYTHGIICSGYTECI